MFVQTAVCGRPHVRWCERERRSYRFSLSTRLTENKEILFSEKIHHPSNNNEGSANIEEDVDELPGKMISKRNQYKQDPNDTSKNGGKRENL